MQCDFVSLDGLQNYESMRRFQHQYVEARIRDEIPDTFIFLEHSPVITQGRGLQRGIEGAYVRHMPAPLSLPSGLEWAESERGGDLTYHGPGQLVIYPICKLDGNGFAPKHDVTAYLRTLELRLIAWLMESWGIVGSAHADATGVWVGEKKLVSIGIAVRKWVTYHGVAINIVNDLAPFQLFSPCGYPSDVMTRLRDLRPSDFREPFDWNAWRKTEEGKIAAHFGCSPRVSLESRFSTQAI